MVARYTLISLLTSQLCAEPAVSGPCAILGKADLLPVHTISRETAAQIWESCAGKTQGLLLLLSTRLKPGAVGEKAHVCLLRPSLLISTSQRYDIQSQREQTMRREFLKHEMHNIHQCPIVLQQLQKCHEKHHVIEILGAGT